MCERKINSFCSSPKTKENKKELVCKVDELAMAIGTILEFLSELASGISELVSEDSGIPCL